MKQSFLFNKTFKNAPQDETSRNAELLIRAGYIDKLMAGVYSYLPLGLRVLNKIKEIVREEMRNLGAQEILMPALQPKALWEETGRWTNPGPNVMFQFKGREGREYGLGWTHEEVVVDIARRRVSSYKDLPLALFQIQDKFRDEPRAKSGLLRGREFSMKDLYSFHADENDLLEFYEKAKLVYQKIFKRCGLEAIVTEASGGDFSQEYSHEFQVLTPSGEDTVFYCPRGDFAQNKEIAKVKANEACPSCGNKIKEDKSIEAGNIFKLYNRYSEPMNLQFLDAAGKKNPVLMGCYGLGPSRVLGAIVEIHHDEKGIIWPTAVAPFQIHLLGLGGGKEVAEETEKLYQALRKQGKEVLCDDRELGAGEKFADADLLGLPERWVVSAKTLAQKSVEIKKRGEEKIRLEELKNVLC